MRKVVVSLAIAADEYIKLYQGSARSVYTETIEGRSIRFPANILQPFVTREGIKGHFSIEFDQGNKFKTISRL
ncbi:MAG: DUF2835 domain-containing protein [Cellvibrionaceae bacterium]